MSSGFQAGNNSGEQPGRDNQNAAVPAQSEPKAALRSDAKVFRPQRQNQTVNGSAAAADAGSQPDSSSETSLATNSDGHGFTNGNGANGGHDKGWVEKKGVRPGDRYIRLTRPALDALQSNPYESLIVSNASNAEPITKAGRNLKKVKRVLVGAPIPTSHAIHERLSKVQALAVLSSDALSSVAYATEEILLVLAAAVTLPLNLSVPIALAIGLLLVVVAASYRQTIHAYPKGGGSYIVAKDNLGVTPGLIAAASLMIDYVLTVAVSVSSGVAAIISAFPSLQQFTVLICLGFVAFIAVANLRGIRESGLIFTAPTYIFIFSLVAILLLGFVKIIFGISIGGAVTPSLADAVHGTENLSLFLILRAFASGCTALTGVEAISDGVPAFKAPESKNAATTLTWMAGILVTTFLGITFLANYFHLQAQDSTAPGYETVLSQLSHVIVGNSWFYYVIQAATALILVLAANTSFSDFPRLSWFLARDKFLPHLFSHRGDRLAFSTGIITLAILSSILIVIFGGNTDALIPLYSVGVFNSFTLSQSGMVARWWRLRNEEKGWRKRMLMNGLGAVATALVLIITAATKFLEGAWLVVCLIPLIYLMFKGIHKHYIRFSQELSLTEGQPEPLNMLKHSIIVPVDGLNQVSERTLAYARAMSDQVTAVHVNDDPEAIERLRRQWNVAIPDIPLVTIETPYRSIIGPFLKYVDDIHKRSPDDVLTVVVPEFVLAKWWQRLLHNQTAFRIRASLFLRPGIIITTVPYHLLR